MANYEDSTIVEIGRSHRNDMLAQRNGILRRESRRPATPRTIPL